MHLPSVACGLLIAALLTAAAGLRAQEQLPEVARAVLDEAARQRDAGRHEQAIEGYREGLRLAPDAPLGYLELGALLHSLGRLDDALEVYEEGVQQVPGDSDLLYNAAVVALQLGHREVALAHVDRGVAATGREARLHLLRGTILGQLERHADAVEALKTAVRLGPRSARAWFSLGNAQQQLGSMDEAVASYRKALRHDPGLSRAGYNLGSVLSLSGRFDEAIDEYRRALATIDAELSRGAGIETFHSRAYLNLGILLMRREELAAAQAAFTKASQIDPLSAEVWFHLGLVGMQQGHLEVAEAPLRRALELPGTPSATYLQLARLMASHGDHRGALELLERAPEMAVEEERQALEVTAEGRLAMGDAVAAEEAYRALLSMDPEDTGAQSALAGLLRRRGKLEEAAALLERVVAQRPDDRHASLELASLARARGDPSRERQLYERVLRQDVHGPEALAIRIRLALLELAEGRLEAARRHLGSALATLDGAQGDGVHDPVRLVAAALSAVDGDLDTARRQLESAGDRTSTARWLAAVLDVAEGRAGGAVAALSRLLGETQGTARMAVAFDLGLVLWSQGRLQEARPHLEEAARRHGQDLALRTALGETYLVEGRYRRARIELEGARASCAAPTASPAVAGTGPLLLRLPRRSGARALCERARRSLARAVAEEALEALTATGGSGSEGRALERAERALALRGGAIVDAVARLVRGTALLLRERPEEAISDLESSLGGALPTRLVPTAQNNLGVALAASGRRGAAARELADARTDGSAPTAAALNLGILLDDGGGAPERALELYAEYLQNGGERRAEVEEWMALLERIYR